MEVKGNLTPEKRAVNVAETDDQSKRQRREPMRGVVLDRVLSPKRSDGGGMEFLHPEVQIPPVPTAVTMSRIDKASTIKLSDCLLKVMSVKGYRTARATHGVSKGCWYYEVVVDYLGETGHCRVGWATKQAHLHAPVGFDQHGYSYRDLEGTKQHKAERQPYGEPFSKGDVIGCLICLSEEEKVKKENQDALDKSETTKEEKIDSTPDSFIAFSKNGVQQGIAFTNLLPGTYFPAVSMFTRPHQQLGVTLSLNFGRHMHILTAQNKHIVWLGPEFIYASGVDQTPPPRPISDILVANEETRAKVMD